MSDFFSSIFVSPNEHQQQFFSRVEEPRAKVPFLVFMGEIKIDLTPKKLFFFLLCYKMAKIMLIPMHKQSQQRYSFCSSRFTSNLVLPASLLGMIK